MFQNAPDSEGIMELRDILPGEYAALYSHMKRDFPPNELPPFSAVKRNLRKRGYEGFFLTCSGMDAGYVLVTAPCGNEFALLQFFAVYPEMRGSGLGSGFLKIIAERYQPRSLVLEVDDPHAAKTEKSREEAVRRIRFYENSGFRALTSVKAKIFGVDMLIMTNSQTFSGNARALMHSLYLPALPSKRWLRFIDVTNLAP